MIRCRPYKKKDKAEIRIILTLGDDELHRAQVDAQCSLMDLSRLNGVTYLAGYLYTVHTGIQWVHVFEISPSPDPRARSGGSFLGVAAEKGWSPRKNRPRLRLIAGGLEGNA